jgi:hypothetical protein
VEYASIRHLWQGSALQVVIQDNGCPSPQTHPVTKLLRRKTHWKLTGSYQCEQPAITQYSMAAQVSGVPSFCQAGSEEFANQPAAHATHRMLDCLSCASLQGMLLPLVARAGQGSQSPMAAIASPAPCQAHHGFGLCSEHASRSAGCSLHNEVGRQGYFESDALGDPMCPRCCACLNNVRCYYQCKSATPQHVLYAQICCEGPL